MTTDEQIQEQLKERERRRLELVHLEKQRAASKRKRQRQARLKGVYPNVPNPGYTFENPDYAAYRNYHAAW